MNKVYTKNGVFIITDSLLESIKSNNDVILLEDSFEKDVKRGLRKERVNQEVQRRLDAESKRTNAEKNEIFSKIDIYLNQMSNNENISSDVMKEMENFISDNKNSNNIDIKNAINDFEENYKNYNDNVHDVEGKNNIAKQEERIQELQNYMDIKTPEDALTFQPLLKEINASEKKAHEIVQRAEDVMEEVMGIWGRTDVTSSSDFSDMQKVAKMNQQELGEYIKELRQNNSVPEDDRNMMLTKLMKYYRKRFGEDYISDVSLPFNNNPQQSFSFNQQQNKNFDTKIKTKSTKAEKYAKNPAILALGGFQIKPYFKDSNDNSEKGYALKYFLEFMKGDSYSSIRNKSYIAKMIETYKNLNKARRTNGVNNSASTEEEKINQQFIKMVDTFLANTVYSVSINNNPKFENAVNAVRIDPNLNGKFKVSTLSTQQQFNVKERIIGFVDTTTGVPCAILIFRPLFARGQEIIKPLQKAISGRVTEG